MSRRSLVPINIESRYRVRDSSLNPERFSSRSEEQSANIMVRSVDGEVVKLSVSS